MHGVEPFTYCLSFPTALAATGCGTHKNLQSVDLDVPPWEASPCSKRVKKTPSTGGPAASIDERAKEPEVQTRWCYSEGSYEAAEQWKLVESVDTEVQPESRSFQADHSFSAL